MAKELTENFPEAKQILECGSDILGFDLAKKMFEADETKLAQTLISQPAIMATSLVALFCAKKEGLSCSAVAGHSLGEYAAMTCSEMLTTEEAFKAIKLRSTAMSMAAAANPGSMAAILGCDNETIEKICEETDGYVVPANYNSAQQTVIAGETSAVDKAIAKFQEFGKKAIKLAVSAAFHTKLMNSASEEFKTEISGFTFKEPVVDFYSNLYGDKLTDFSDMPSYLSKHIISPVKFTMELQKLSENGYENFIELGPNKVLTGLVKKTLKGVNAVNIENMATLTKALELR